MEGKEDIERAQLPPAFLFCQSCGAPGSTAACVHGLLLCFFRSCCFFSLFVSLDGGCLAGVVTIMLMIYTVFLLSSRLVGLGTTELAWHLFSLVPEFLNLVLKLIKERISFG